MNARKERRIARDRLLLADYEAVFIDGTPIKFRSYKLPKKFKTFFQFRDPIRNAYWSVELLIELEEESVKVLEVIPRGLTYTGGLFIQNNDYSYRHPTESVAGWQLELVQSNLNKLSAHSIALGIARFTHKGGGEWLLSGKDISDLEFQEIKTELAIQKRERFTPEKSREVAKVLDQERERAERTRTRYRGNEVISEVFGVSLKTAEKWSARVRVSAQESRNKKTKRKGENAKSKKARR